MDELLNAIATVKPLTTAPPAAPSSSREDALRELVCLQEQVMFAFRMVIENNLPLPPDARLALFEMHDSVRGIGYKLIK